CLLPLLDMLNHRPGHQLAWEASAGQVVFRAVREIPPGQEVFTNYGGQKSNEDLLFFYGFAELDAEVSYDVVSGFVISCGVAPSDTSALENLAARHQKLASERVPCKLEGIENRGVLTLGPFSLDPAASALLPPALLQGLRLLTGDDDEELATSSNDAVKIKEQDPMLSMEAIGLLHASLRASLAAEKAAPPPAEPKSRATYIRAYREGRCRIFEEALFEVEELALQHANEEEEEEEREEVADLLTASHGNRQGDWIARLASFDFSGVAQGVRLIASLPGFFARARAVTAGQLSLRLEADAEEELAESATVAHLRRGEGGATWELSSARGQRLGRLRDSSAEALAAAEALGLTLQPVV
ncbi:unnamed protein product, partial [Polarella glacialis]